MRDFLRRSVAKRWPVYVLAYLVIMSLAYTGALSLYYVTVLCYICIDAIMASGLNLTNGYMGETNLGYAGFVGIGAYVSVVLTTAAFRLTPRTPFVLKELLFLAAILCGGIAAGLAGLLLSIPAFKTRGDYLAMVTYGFNMIVLNIVNNVEAVGGARGYQGIAPDNLILRLTNFTWVFVSLIVCLILVRNFMASGFGRDLLSIRESEVAAELMGVNTRRAKVYCFALSSFFGGVAGGFYVHLLQYAHPSMFGVLKSVDLLAMVYLGGMATLAGPLLGAATYNVMLEGLRQVLRLTGTNQIWRMVVAPMILIILMLRRPWGLMGRKEHWFFAPPGLRPPQGVRPARQGTKVDVPGSSLR